MLAFLNTTLTDRTAELKPIHDSRKSFYKKAFIHRSEESDALFLLSYGTSVCFYDPRSNQLFFERSYSNTTNRHVWEFILQIEDETNLKINEAYWKICECEKLKSFTQFLHAVSSINLKEKTYGLRNERKIFKY